MSIALRHKRKLLATTGAAEIGRDTSTKTDKTGIVSGKAGQQFEALKASLSADLETLKLSNGDEERNPFKIELIEKYRSMAETLMASHQNWAGLKSVFYFLMWRLDIEGFEAVQADLFRGIEHGLTTPDSFKRDFQTLYLDQLQEYVAAAMKAEAEFNVDYLQTAIQALSTGNLVTVAPLKAKLYAWYGKVCLMKNEPEQAIKSFETALNLDERVGVKTILKETKAQVNPDGE